MKPVSPALSSSFPAGFAWGAASASYQIEGAAAVDGKGPSIWDMFCRRGDRVWAGQSGEIACDHYHRYREDVALMKEIGLKAYRLSVAWPRVMPEGTGAINAAGLEFYDRLVDELLGAGIAPWVTLYHWDLPYALYCRGGWLNRDIVGWFADYATAVVDRLSDRVRHWITLNEPQVFIGLGLQNGRHAPGDRLGTAEVVRAAHHALLAHGTAVQVIRARARQPVQVGWAPAGAVGAPATDSPADVAAARLATFSAQHRHLLVAPGDDTSLWSNTWWWDPVIFGHYPEDVAAQLGPAMVDAPAEDLRTICQPMDFFGINLYHCPLIRAGSNGLPEKVARPLGYPITAHAEWPVSPEVVYWGPKFFAERYALPVVITENGVSCRDWVSLDGAVHDPDRIDFLARYLGQIERAIRDGVDLRGYFLWAVMDNFEWAEGVRERFGLIFVDYPTQRRTIKDSGRWYGEVIKANGLTHACESRRP